MESALEPRTTTSFRRCCSAPVLSWLAPQEEEAPNDEKNLQVYVVARPFQEMGGAIMKRLPEEYKGFAVQIGICHYLTVFKTRDGRYFQFDFGPQGGRDVHANGGPLSWLLREENSQPVVRKKKNNVMGEIREAMLVELPAAHVYMGESRLSIEDIRNFNGIQSMDYELHKHDCRHYVNNLVQYTTGVNAASVKFVKEYFKTQGENAPPLSSTVVGLLQSITDVSNWSRVKTTGKATVAALLYLAGSSAVRARPPAVPIPKRPVKRAAMTALASVAASCPEIPMVKGAAAIGSMVTEGAKKVTTGTASFVETASRGVTRSMIPERGNALALASAVTRGAAGFVTAPFRRTPERAGGNPARLPWLGRSRRKLTGNSPPSGSAVS
ncbi:hypothetical protein BSKO_00418 [Bryopsis sp. KO-2023]|nr:hypothetical protein BSKO_00418 [Bryopsis sp. KO-2023]